MYLEHFQLSSRPFPQIAKANGCVMFPGFKRELDRCIAAIEEYRCPSMITGLAGCGKSTLLAVIESRMATSVRTLRLGCASLRDRTEWFQMLLFETGHPFETGRIGELRLAFIDFLKSPEHCPNGMLLLIDEAHCLPDEVLEEIRLMTNLVCHGRPQVRVVLAGVIELEERLAQNESFNQRIAHRGCLAPLTYQETMLFVLAQMQTAGRDGRQIFLPSALERLHARSAGVPRLICQLGDAALRVAAARNSRTIDASVIDQAWNDFLHLSDKGEEIAAAAPAPARSVVEFGQLAPATAGGQASSVQDIRPGRGTAPETTPVPVRPANQGFSEPVRSHTSSASSRGNAPPAAAEIGFSGDPEAAFQHVLQQLDHMDPQVVGNAPSAPNLMTTGEVHIADGPSRQNSQTGAGNIDPSMLFGEGFEQEEDVAWRADRQIALQNVAAAQLEGPEIPRLVDPGAVPAWIADDLAEIVVASAPPAGSPSPVVAPAERSSSEMSGTQSSDDRDIIMISSAKAERGGSQRDVPEPQQTEPGSNSPPVAGRATGQVMRVDYSELFRQLRNSPAGDP